MLEQMLVLDELMHWQKLHRGHAQLGEMLDRCRMGHPRVRAAQVFRDVRVQHREAFDMNLIDD
jgi:hypothetical protein